MPQTAEILLRMKANQVGVNDFGGPNFTPKIEELLQLASGTGANQFDIPFFDERSIAASTDDDIDLAGVLTSAFGSTITMAEMVALLIINKPRAGSPANVSDLTIGGGSNPFLGFLSGTTPKIGPIKPGGFLLLGSPHASGIGTVAAGTGDILRISNGAGGIAKVQLGILARTA